MEIFKHFPYLFCCEYLKMQRFFSEFKKYKFSKDQVIKLCKESGGILASRVSNFIGLFDYLRVFHKIQAKEVVQMIDQCPQFVYLNKKSLLKRKVELI